MSLEYVRELQDKVNRNEVTRQMKVALAGEFNAHHNLIMQGAMVEGHQKIKIKKQLENMQSHEKDHIRMLVDRIMELGGNPDIRPISWDNLATCDYRPITSTDQRSILEIAYETKKCKSTYYSGLLQFLEPKDRTSYDIVTRILEDDYQDMEVIKGLQSELMSEGEKSTAESLARGQQEIPEGEIDG